MSKNMTIRDRRRRAVLIAPVALPIGILIGPRVNRPARALRTAATMLATSAAGYGPLYSRSGRVAATGNNRGTDAMAKGVI